MTEYKSMVSEILAILRMDQPSALPAVVASDYVAGTVSIHTTRNLDAAVFNKINTSVVTGSHKVSQAVLQ